MDPDEREDLRRQLDAVLSARATQDTSTWAIFAAFWATNAILLVAMFGRGRGPDPASGVFIAWFGFVSAVAWALMVGRALWHVRRYLGVIQGIEERLGVPGEIAISAHLDTKREPPAVRIGTTYLMPAVAVIAAVTWGLLFVFELLRLGP